VTAGFLELLPAAHFALFGDRLGVRHCPVKLGGAIVGETLRLTIQLLGVRLLLSGGFVRPLVGGFHLVDRSIGAPFRSVCLVGGSV
jgi:hypothetical protein